MTLCPCLFHGEEEKKLCLCLLEEPLNFTPSEVGGCS